MTTPRDTANEVIAAERLPAFVREYVAASASSVDAYVVDSWDALRILPRALRRTESAEIATTVLGTPVASPVLVAPMAQQVAAHPDGEVAIAEAVSARGGLLAVSTNTGVPFERIRSAGAPWWFQVYPLADRKATRALVERATAAGARALMLTVDTTALVVTGPGIEPTEWPPGTGGWLANLTSEERDSLQGRPSVPATIEDIGWLRQVSGGLPVVVKGLLHPHDARAAVDAGAAAVLVSTHGGRRSGLSVSSAEALPHVVAALDGTGAEVYVDSGIRTGHHAFAALSLGARAVFLGRPIWWALAAGGATAVERELARVDDELVLSLRQSGVGSIDRAIDAAAGILQRSGSPSGRPMGI